MVDDAWLYTYDIRLQRAALDTGNYVYTCAAPDALTALRKALLAHPNGDVLWLRKQGRVMTDFVINSNEKDR